MLALRLVVMVGLLEEQMAAIFLFRREKSEKREMGDDMQQRLDLNIAITFLVLDHQDAPTLELI